MVKKSLSRFCQFYVFLEHPEYKKLGFGMPPVSVLVCMYVPLVSD
jgi:hypothetical protein